FLIGNAVGQNEIHGADQFSGEAGRAEHTLYKADLRPNDEHVLIQSKALTTRDREFGDTVDQVVGRLVGTKHVQNVRSPLAGDAPVSHDGHSALVDFQITGNDVQARDRVSPSQDAVKAVQAQHPGLFVAQFGTVSTNQELQNTFKSDLGKAELLSFPI